MINHNFFTFIYTFLHNECIINISEIGFYVKFMCIKYINKYMHFMYGLYVLWFNVMYNLCLNSFFFTLQTN